MNSINNIIIKLASLLPKGLIKPLAFNYVAGESINSAIKVVEALNSQGLAVTLDILGEHTKTLDQSKKITNDYLDILDEINSRSLDSNISVKPTHLGLDVSIDAFKNNLKLLLKNKFKNFIRIDMESSLVTDKTINTWLELYSNNNSGIVIQAYLKRSMDDIKKIHNNNIDFNVRICKGIYRENKDIAFKDPKSINSNYLKLARYCFENNIYVCIATHDGLLLESLYNLIDEIRPDPERFEFQVLYGVPMEVFIAKNKRNNFKTRVYVPFGRDWHPYSIRRMKENPKILAYVIKNFIK